MIEHIGTCRVYTNPGGACDCRRRPWPGWVTVGLGLLVLVALTIVAVMCGNPYGAV